MLTVCNNHILLVSCMMLRGQCQLCHIMSVKDDILFSYVSNSGILQSEALLRSCNPRCCCLYVNLVAGNALEIGSLQDLRAAGKGGLDPNGDAVSSSLFSHDCLNGMLAECVPECCAISVGQKLGSCSRSTSASIVCIA